MTDEEPENLVLELLRKIQGDLADLKAVQRSILLELSNQFYAMHGYNPEPCYPEQEAEPYYPEPEETPSQAPPSRPRERGPLP